jgi:hypothetical protein
LNENEDLHVVVYITEEGLSALLDAQQGVTNAVRIAELGLTASAFVPAPTLEELPGEFKRIAMVAGEAVNDRVIHMVALDDTADAYTVRGFALYLDNGALFGVAGQGEPLFQKSTASSFLMAADVTFAQAVAELIEFGDANFLYPPATRTRKGVAYLSTDAEAAAGDVDDKILTPKGAKGVYLRLVEKGAAGGVAPIGADGKIPPQYLPAQDSIDTYYAASNAEMTALAAAGPGDFCQRTDLTKTYRLAAAPPSVLGNWVEFLSPGAPVRTVNGEIGDVVLTAAKVGAPPTSRAVVGAGLAQGGGSFAADRAITVPAASRAQAEAGAATDVALTPDSIAGILALLAGRIPGARQILTAGLAQGGGDLTIDRIITVLAATAQDARDGTRSDVALTPASLAGLPRTLGPSGELMIPGTPFRIKWGEASVYLGSQTVYFPEAYPVACWHVFLTFYGNPNNGDESDEPVWIQRPIAPGSFIISTAGDRYAVPMGWFAIGM